LQQVNLAGLYGVSCAAAAWIFILHGCKSGRYSSIVIGYALILIVAAYKSQIFVANAFLAMMYPCLFFVGLRASKRWLIASALVVLFVIVVQFSQGVQEVPTLSLDFSFLSAGEYARRLLWSYDPGFFKSLFSWLILPPRPRVITGLSAAGMILLASFGVWLAAFGVVFLGLWKRLEPAVLFFPLLLMVNYLVMALCLSLNTAAALGTVDELQNRPLVWAYFGVVCWTSGAAYALLFGDGLPRRQSTRVGLVVLLLLSFVTPWRFANNFITFPASSGFASFDEFSSFPSCLVRAAQYIREHSQNGEVIQDSADDPKMLLGALTERKEFAVDWWIGWRSKALEERLHDLDVFKASKSEADLTAFLSKNKIAWYLLRPDAKVSWPEAYRRKSSFDCNGYQVYRVESSAF
jgi:hypothetical protein